MSPGLKREMPTSKGDLAKIAPLSNQLVEDTDQATQLKGDSRHLRGVHDFRGF